VTLRVSVIIATYNRAGLLDECLTHLRRQPFGPDDEVIVADNASTDSTPVMVAAHQSRAGVTLRYVHVPRPGKSFALQDAVAGASGDLLAFLDDDVLVDEGWLPAIRAAMQDPAVTLAGGPVLPRWERPAPPWLDIGSGPYGRLASPIALLHYGPAVCELGSRTLLGANMAIRRAALDALGGFATHLGKLRGTLLSGEDADICDRVQQRGWKAVYRPDAIVRHWVPASRMRLGYFGSWFYWSGITHAAMEGGTPRAKRVLGVPPWILRHGVTAAAAALRAGLRVRRDLLVHALADGAFVAGYAAWCWGLVRTGAAVTTQTERTSRCASRPSLS